MASASAWLRPCVVACFNGGAQPAGRSARRLLAVRGRAPPVGACADPGLHLTTCSVVLTGRFTQGVNVQKTHHRIVATTPSLPTPETARAVVDTPDSRRFVACSRRRTAFHTAFGPNTLPWAAHTIAQPRRQTVLVLGSGLHSFTLQLNVSTFCWIRRVHDFPPVY